MAKIVLLARPHPFIVAEMKPYLEQAGYISHKLENLSDLGAQAKSAAGAVVSLALSSSVGESAEEIFKLLRKDAPHVPVLFAAMLTLDRSQNSLKRIAK